MIFACTQRIVAWLRWLMTRVLGKDTRERDRIFLPFMGILIYPLISDSRIRVLRTKCNQSWIMPKISHIFFSWIRFDHLIIKRDYLIINRLTLQWVCYFVLSVLLGPGRSSLQKHYSLQTICRYCEKRVWS